ncbi:alpha-ribazole phosphatase [Flavobacterium sp. JP2137]|uniref:alpha-ribazole phosphatase n=1 Tax=Flavobacterium sp. JP2137 TaxID=3414510 RepID=UPI003D2FDF56
MEIYVIRHTEVSVPAGSCYGQTDVPLTAQADEQIQAVVQQLPTDFDQVISSPLTRCRLLAAQISAVDRNVDDRLMEMNFGQWENQTWDDLDSEPLRLWMEDFVYTKTPSGESLEELYLRVEDFVEQLRLQDYKKIALVTHAGVIRCIWAYLLEIPLHNIFKIPVVYGETLVVKLGEDKNRDQLVKTLIPS